MADTYEKRARQKRKEQRRRQKAEEKRLIKENGPAPREPDDVIAARYVDPPEHEDE